MKILLMIFHFKKRKIRSPLIFLFAFLFPLSAYPCTEMKVTRVVDGDSLHVDYQGSVYKIRLAEIDAPELGQPYGEEAKSYLASLVSSKLVCVSINERDRYNRYIARINVQGKNLSEEMVRAGFAWHYKSYSHDITIENLELNAIVQGHGLWKDPSPIPPWHWRKVKQLQKNSL